jgi:hypothetical protein
LHLQQQHHHCISIIIIESDDFVECASDCDFRATLSIINVGALPSEYIWQSTGQYFHENKLNEKTDKIHLDIIELRKDFN